MYKRYILHISIHCEVPVTPKVYRQLFQYTKKINESKIFPCVRIHIDDFDTQEEMISIQELMYGTVVTTNVPLKIVSSNELFTALITIIELSLEQIHSEQLSHIEYSLIIFVYLKESDNMLYNFKWSFKA